MNANETTDNTRDARGRFSTGNPGKQAGTKCGRARALAALDSMMSDEANLATLEKALLDSFNKNPVKFFTGIIMPLLPRDSRLEVTGPVEIKWKSLKETIREDDEALDRIIKSRAAAAAAVAAAPGNETT
jgi:hypothetical protein